MKKTTILMVAAISLLYACSKDKGNDDSDPLKEAAKQLQTNITGKWEFQNISLEGAPKLNQISVAMKDLHRLNGIVLSGIDPEPGSSTGYIEFLSDSTYMLYDSEGRYFQGKFQANAGDSISLARLGSLGGIKLADGKLDFRLYYSAGSKSIVVSGNKAASIPMDTRTAQLCRAWYLTPEAYGAEVYENGDDWYNEETRQYESYEVDSAVLIMTASGTEMIQTFFAGKLMVAEVNNWKWHSTKSDRYVFARHNEEYNEDENYMIITELNSTVLKAYEEWDDDGDGTIDTEWNYVFRPAY